MGFYDGYPSPEWYQVSSAWEVTNAIKLAIATSTSAVSYTGAQLDGAVGQGAISPSKLVEVTSSAVASVYNTTNPIVFTGLDYAGNVITDSVRLTAVGGGETVMGVKAFSSVTKIDVPAMLLGTGQLSFGVGDLCFEPPARNFEAGAAGTFKLIAQSGLACNVTLLSGAVRNVAVKRVDKTNATFPFIVYR